MMIAEFERQNLQFGQLRLLHDCHSSGLYGHVLHLVLLRAARFVESALLPVNLGAHASCGVFEGPCQSKYLD